MTATAAPAFSYRTAIFTNIALGVWLKVGTGLRATVQGVHQLMDELTMDEIMEDYAIEWAGALVTDEGTWMDGDVEHELTIDDVRAGIALAQAMIHDKSKSDGRMADALVASMQAHETAVMEEGRRLAMEALAIEHGV